MQYNDIKECLMDCPDLAGLNEAAAAALFWRGQEKTLDQGEVVYAEGEALDHTFGILMSGDLVVERDGEPIGGIWEREVFGEMAHFTNQGMRTATVRVGSPQAVILKFKVSREDLDSPDFSALRKCLSRHTWNRFVSASQHFAI